MDYRTPLSRARGLGSAHEGTGHFVSQRLSSWALIPLTFWFVVALAYLAGSDSTQATDWFHQPLNALLFISFLLVTLWHANLGVQVVIEDYLYCDVLKIISLMLLKGTMALLTIAGLYFIVHISFATGAA